MNENGKEKEEEEEPTAKLVRWSAGCVQEVGGTWRCEDSSA